MGCCVSTPSQKVSPRRKNDAAAAAISKSPPRAEEEAVKEVLSETPSTDKPASPATDHLLLPTATAPPYLYTPIPKITSPSSSSKQLRPRPPSTNTTPPRKRPPPSSTTAAAANNQRTDQIRHHHPPPPPNHFSAQIPAITPPEEISEICSLSETVSTTATADIDAGEVRQRCSRSSAPPNNYRYPGSNSGPRSTYNKSPAKRIDRISPRRAGRDTTTTNTGPPGSSRRNYNTTTNGRRVAGDANSGNRRSRSPAMRNQSPSLGLMGRSPSARRATTTGVSPGRARMMQPHPGISNNTTSISTRTGVGCRSSWEDHQKGIRMDDDDVDAVVSSSVKGEEDSSSQWGDETEAEREAAGPSESLENPLVSLECFIFL